MTRPDPRSPLLGLLWLALAAGPGCGKKNLDASVDRLVKAAERNDYADFKAMSHPDLAAKFGPSQFGLLTKMMKQFGKLEKRSMRKINVRSGGIRHGFYKLRFEKGKADLDVTLRNGKLVAFEFTGDDVSKALEAFRKEAMSSFQVGGLRFEGRPGTEEKPEFKVGEDVKFTLELLGLTRAGGGVQIKVGLEVRTQTGAKMIDAPSFFDRALPLAADDLPVATVTGTIKLAGPGEHTLVFTVTDVPSQKRIEYRKVVTAKP
jgi:hypothetical protein